MYSLIKSRIKQLLRNGQGWSGDYASWQEAQEHCRGYDAGNILQKVKDATLKVKEGKAVYERDSVIFDKIEYSYPLLAALLWAAARNEGKISVIDFGGSLGSSYFQNRKFLEGLNEVRWNIVEQANYVNAGKESIQDNTLRFYHSVTEALAGNTPDVLLISCTLPYIEAPYQLIKELMAHNIPQIIIDNTPFNFERRDRITVQKVPPSIYPASYPCWFLDYQKVKSTFQANYEVVSEHLNDSIIELDGRQIRYRGLLMVKKAHS